MRIRILLAGRVRERYLQAGMAEYLKRLGPHARVEVQQLPDGALASAIDPAAYLIALDLRGQPLSSEEFAAFIQERGLRGDSHLVFAIGGSTGLAPAVLARARFRLSLGPMTFPHQLVPLLLLEQIYRAFQIAAGMPYHK